MHSNVMAVRSVASSMPQPSSAMAIQDNAPSSLTMILAEASLAEMLLSTMSATALSRS
jgi:hypothetical protein